MHISNLNLNSFSDCFSDIFLQNDVDLAMFTTLKEEDLASLGIRSYGARKILLNTIQGNYIFN